MHDTPPPPPPRERDTRTLLDDLCFALRDVGVHDGQLPDGARVVAAIGNVRVIHAELATRRVDLADRLQDLSAQTRWRMNDLLLDCLGFPETLPYVREEDGVRRFLRCSLCSRAERPVSSKAFWMCDGCLRRVIEAIETRVPTEGVVLFRTYNVDARCEHAGPDTVLAAETMTDIIFGNCRRCFADELARRKSEAKTVK